MLPTARRVQRIVGLVTSFSIALGACSAGGLSDFDPSGEPSLPASTPSAAPGEASLADASPDAWLVVGRRGEVGLRVILAGTREQIYELPLGVPDATWGRVVSAIPNGSTTEIRQITVQPDLPAVTRSIEGPWRLPTIGADPLPVGVSADGSTIVLVEDGVRADATRTRFAILIQGEEARTLDLAGSFDYDALSPDGSILYVVEHLPTPPDGHYQVRAIDLATGVMDEAVIVDKRNLEASMGGWPITQARHSNGVVFTLYRGTAYPFVHALNSTEAWAVCLDLPAAGAGDSAAALDWGLAQSPDGRSVFAVNGTLGLAVEMDSSELTTRRTTAFTAPTAAAGFSLAKFGHQETGPAGRRVVAAADGSTVFAAGVGGIVQLETKGLTATGTLLEGVPVDALALTPDGTTIYALLLDGRIVMVDVAGGEIVGSVPGDGFDRLVAIVPW